MARRPLLFIDTNAFFYCLFVCFCVWQASLWWYPPFILSWPWLAMSSCACLSGVLVAGLLAVARHTHTHTHVDTALLDLPLPFFSILLSGVCGFWFFGSLSSYIYMYISLYTYLCICCVGFQWRFHVGESEGGEKEHGWLHYSCFLSLHFKKEENEFLCMSSINLVRACECCAVFLFVVKSISDVCFW